MGMQLSCCLGSNGYWRGTQSPGRNDELGIYEKLDQSMSEAGAEEKRLAIERGSYNEGVPAITVIVDGSWSKRSHKHSYNANSGVAIIVGKSTGKLLHIYRSKK